jgi:2,4-dienoyl-CoA reductase-like NADH-dependent reductase (Old Yellow Enzyme family)/thioredoxin reductase
METNCLFRSIRLGKIEVKNRLVMPPMVTNYATPEGRVSERMLRYYAARAKGGIGLIVLEAAYSGSYRPPGRLYVGGGNGIAELKHLAQTLQGLGAKVALQINPATEKKGRLTAQDIDSIIQECVQGAATMKKCNLDAVQVHPSNEYIDFFFSPTINRRTDSYGGSLENRARFACELIKAIKNEVGKDFPVIVRFCAADHLPGGFGVEESKCVAQYLEVAGADALDIVSGISESFEYIIPPQGFPDGSNSRLAAEIKKEVNIPIIVAGKINDPSVAAGIIMRQEADMVDLGRALIAEAEWPNKVAMNQVEDLRSCIACNLGCISRCLEALPIRCTINPVLGEEIICSDRKKMEKKSVLVVGGGPGGLQAALVAAEAGHQVELCEKNNKLGGQLNPASSSPSKHDLHKFKKYLEGQVEKMGVKVFLNTEVDLKYVEEKKPDLVIVATGAEPVIPEIEGMEHLNCISAGEVLEGLEIAGEKIIVLGGGMVGMEVCEYLFSREKKNVTVVEMLNELAKDMEIFSRKVMLERIKGEDIKIFSGAQIRRFDKGGAWVEQKGQEFFIEGDTLVYAIGMKANNSLGEELKGKYQIFKIGDSIQPRRIQDAVYEAYKVAINI